MRTERKVTDKIVDGLKFHSWMWRDKFGAIDGRPLRALQLMTWFGRIKNATYMIASSAPITKH